MHSIHTGVSERFQKLTTIRVELRENQVKQIQLEQFMKIWPILTHQEIFHQFKSIPKLVLNQLYLLDRHSKAMKLSKDTLDLFKVRMMRMIRRKSLLMRVKKYDM